MLMHETLRSLFKIIRYAVMPKHLFSKKKAQVNLDISLFTCFSFACISVPVVVIHFFHANNVHC